MVTALTAVTALLVMGNVAVVAPAVTVTDGGTVAALTLLLDRKKIIEQLYRNEYVPLNTFFPQQGYQNPGNPENPYARQEALQLLAEAGWSTRDAQGRLSKAGKPLELQMLYDGPAVERVLSVYQEDLKKAGITLGLERVSFETRTLRGPVEASLVCGANEYENHFRFRNLRELEAARPRPPTESKRWRY